jgi:hypothetical protein
VLTHTAFLALAAPGVSPQTAQRALQLFGTFDLSVPRALVPGELDARFSWPAGSTQRLLNSLADLNILVTLSRGRLSSGGVSLWMISDSAGWTPKSLMEQWSRLESSVERAAVAYSSPHSSSS